MRSGWPRDKLLKVRLLPSPFLPFLAYYISPHVYFDPSVFIASDFLSVVLLLFRNGYNSSYLVYIADDGFWYRSTCFWVVFLLTISSSYRRPHLVCLLFASFLCYVSTRLTSTLGFHFGVVSQGRPAVARRIALFFDWGVSAPSASFHSIRPFAPLHSWCLIFFGLLVSSIVWYFLLLLL